MVGIILNDDASAPSQMDHIIEQGRGVYKLLDRDGGKGNTRLTKKYSTKRFHNVKDVKDNEKFQSVFNSNPSEEAYFVCWACCLDVNDDPGDIWGTITIDYIVALHEPKDFTQS